MPKSAHTEPQGLGRGGLSADHLFRPNPSHPAALSSATAAADSPSQGPVRNQWSREHHVGVHLLQLELFLLVERHPGVSPSRQSHSGAWTRQQVECREVALPSAV